MENVLHINWAKENQGGESLEEGIQYEKYLEAISLEISTVQELIPEIDVTDLHQDYPGSPIQQSSRKEFVDIEKKLVDLRHAYARPKVENIKENPKIIAAFESFRGQTVVDLGAGQYSDGYEIANIGDASAYIGVEPAHAVMLARRIAIRKNSEIGKMNYEAKEIAMEVTNHAPNEIKGIPASVVREDMLTFLHRVPDASVSIFCSGIDRVIIEDEEYRRLVGEQIRRVLSPNGAYIGDASVGHIELEGILEKKNDTNTDTNTDGNMNAHSIVQEKIGEGRKAITVYRKVV